MILTAVDDLPVIFRPCERRIPRARKGDDRHALALALGVVHHEGFLQGSDCLREQHLQVNRCTSDTRHTHADSGRRSQREGKEHSTRTSTSFSATSIGSWLRSILLPFLAVAGPAPAFFVAPGAVRHAGGACVWLPSSCFFELW